VVSLMFLENLFHSVEGLTSGLGIILCDFCLMEDSLIGLVESFVKESEIFDEF
jgi:hypothetical protein